MKIISGEQILREIDELIEDIKTVDLDILTDAYKLQLPERLHLLQAMVTEKALAHIHQCYTNKFQKRRDKQMLQWGWSTEEDEDDKK